MLCAVCVWMFQGTSAKGNHHDTYEDLVKAADLGCKVCIYLQKLRDMRGADEAGEKLRPFTTYTFQAWKLSSLDARHRIVIRSKASWLMERSMGGVDLHISKPSPAPRWWQRFVLGIKQDLEAKPWNVRDDDFGSRHIPKNTGDPEVSELGLEWLDTCQTSHSLCQAAEHKRTQDYFPRRLLDVGTLSWNHIRLILTDVETPSHQEQYATLSHCWGKDPSFLRLTTENLPQLKTTIALQSLPQNFIDAIVTCRRLKIRYLWIDSLCILQSGLGAEQDWHRHVNEMHIIYANCSLNIAIAHARSPEYGAFAERNPSFLQNTTVCMPIRKKFSALNSRDVIVHHEAHGFDKEETGDEDEAELAVECDHQFDETEICLVTVFAEYYDYSSFVLRQALWSRGWVFQERLMAPRMLVFGSDRIYWRCREQNTNEYLPHGLPQTGEMFDQHFIEPFTLFEAPTREDLLTEKLPVVYEQWYELVDRYSGTNLTYPEKDKLSAFAAIARHFHRLIPGRYCAGIFESDLHFGLLWRPIYEGKRKFHLERLGCEMDITIDPNRSHKYQAPTWSWASVNDTTAAPEWQIRGARRILADIESVSIDLEDPQNPFGQIRSAELTIRGTLTDLADILEGWSSCPLPLEQRLYGFFILETMDHEISEGVEQTVSYKNCVILAHVHSNTYQRRGILEISGPPNDLQFLEGSSEHRTVVII